MNLTAKQEQFCLNILQGMTQREAWGKAGYSTKYSMAILDANASHLANRSKVKTRVAELRNLAASPTIMPVTERKERLSEIARARLTDYTCCGPDRDLVNVGPESPNIAALQSIETRTAFDENGAKPTVVTRIKLHNPIQAIAELNKMGGDYAPEKHAVLGDILIEVVYRSKPKELS